MTWYVCRRRSSSVYHGITEFVYVKRGTTTGRIVRDYYTREAAVEKAIEIVREHVEQGWQVQLRIDDREY